MQHNILRIIIILIVSFNFLIADRINFTDKEKEFIKKNQIITVGAETDWAPFDFVEDGKYTGVAKEYLDLIEEKSGLKFQYKIDTWENLLQKAKTKEIDLLPCLSKSPDREEFLLFTENYITTRDYLIAKTDNKSIKSISDIDGKTVVIVKGYVQDEVFKRDFPNVKIIYVNSLIESLDKIITNKADFLVSNIALVNYLIQKHNLTQIEAKFQFGHLWNKLYMAAGHHNKTLRNIIQKSLNSITKENKNKIYKKWINKDLEEKQTAENLQLNLSNQEKEFIQKKKNIYIANEFDWIPFDFNEDNVPKGYVIDYVKLISKKLDLNPIFITKKWTDLLNDFKDKKIDLLPVISFNKKRKEFLFYTEPFMSQNLSITVKSSRSDIINMDDLNNKKLGMIKNWNITNILKSQYPNINVIEFDSLDDIFDAIQNNFIDATIQNNILSNYYINKNYYGALKSNTKIVLKEFDSRLFMGVRQDLPILHGLINKAIKTVTPSELKLLEDKWIKTVGKIDFTKEEKNFIQNKKVNVLIGSVWAPFTFVENDKLHGISIDLWEYVKDKANLKTSQEVKFHFTDILESFKAKEADMILATTTTKDREKFAIFTNPYLTAPIGIATTQDKNFMKSAKELIGHKIAVGKNYSAHKLLVDKYPTMEFVFVSGVKEGLEYVSKNKAYAYVDIMPVLSYNIKKYSFTNLKISGQTGIDFKLSSMIQPDSPLLKSIIDKTVASMSYDERQEILDKWFQAKFEKQFDYSLLWKIVVVFILILFFMLYKNRQLRMYQVKLEKAQKQTQHTLESFKTLINFNIAGILIVKDNKIVYLNEELLRILKFNSKEELVNQNINTVLDLQNSSEGDTTLRDLNEAYDSKAIKSDGSKIPVLLRSNAIVFENKASTIVSVVDLSDIKNKEEILIQQSKMASLGEMIGNIAHQWRQPLSYISTAASGMKVQKEFNNLSDEEFVRLTDGIVDTTMFLSQTIDDFRDYIKGEKIQKEFNIKSCIQRVLSLMDGSFINNFIKVTKNIDDIRINGYENELNQVLLNLLSNSKDALKEIKQKDRYVFINSFQQNQNVIIEVIDTGGGISEKILEKVFDPYFTTKHKSQGTGLGLYMTHNIVTQSLNGKIKIENDSYESFLKCTKVTISLPITI